jgi:hypothetical protein
MQIFCSIITLMLINVSCLLISFNMDSILDLSMEDETEEILPTTDYSTSFDLTDLLDLDIFDFDVDELERRSKEDEHIFVNSRHHKSLA